MILRVLDTGLGPARWNAAMSAALLESVDAGRAPPTLRFHRYHLSCVLGRHQDAETELDLPACRAQGIEIARRVTGGGAVVMGPGVLAFDFAIAGTYAELHDIRLRAGDALVAALRGAGFAPSLATAGSIEIGGLKVSGSAGRLGRRAALHQATLIVDLSKTAPLALLRRRTEGGRPTADPRHRVTDMAAQFHRLRSHPSPLAGEGGPCVSKGRMRGRDSTSTAAFHPSSVSAPRCHLLPQGAKELAETVQACLILAIAGALRLRPEPGVPSPAELACADDILARKLGRDDFVYAGDVDERRAA